MPILLQTLVLLALSNIFMTFAWYGHLSELKNKALLIAVVVSWGIAFFEYLIQVPANRIGHNGGYSVGQLKILQEVISLSVFVPIAYFYLKEPIKWDYLWAALCVFGAIFFAFRGRVDNPKVAAQDPPAQDPPAQVSYSEESTHTP